ncbi:hypothetical protein DFR86_00255 [Acidianus sulfidivorans JP7]|uniref:Uncharacterized protein n=1 Tax=Acidianus sulfidivorans JP7 TaxID=619593 RepID=A0A2U9IJC8_9CREN|nr:hypothetical protein [Acidianus sulfidivorans]AWR96133.1 hypothetical protein DFR86_00255 [Acidianus sulfidivorans JP7]
MNKKYYIVIASVVLVTIVLLALLNFNTIIFLDAKYLVPHSINVFFFKGTKMITNVSVSLFAFWPTSNGTVFKKIYQGHNLEYISIPLSNLTDYVKHWIKHYNYTIIPSLIGFASYYVKNSNSTITIYSQPFTVRVSPYNVTHGIGKTIIKEFSDPIVKTVKINSAKSNSQQTTTNTITTTLPQVTGKPFTICYLANVEYYPSNNSLGPLPLAVAYVTNKNLNDYAGGLSMKIDGCSIANLKMPYGLSFGLTVADGFKNYQIAGISITLNQESVNKNQHLRLEDKTQSLGHVGGVNYTNFAEIYTLGQIAIANYTEYLITDPGEPGGNEVPLGSVAMYFVTGLQVIENNSITAPALYITSYPMPSNISPTDFFSSNNLSLVNVGSNREVFYVFSAFQNTSYGLLAFNIPLWFLYYLSPGVNQVAPELKSLISPYVSIEVFVNIYEAHSSAVIGPIITGPIAIYGVIVIGPLNFYTYRIYMMYSNVSYNIGGSNYSLPFYFFYINYSIY